MDGREWLQLEFYRARHSIQLSRLQLSWQHEPFQGRGELIVFDLDQQVCVEGGWHGAHILYIDHLNESLFARLHHPVVILVSDCEVHYLDPEYIVIGYSLSHSLNVELSHAMLSIDACLGVSKAVSAPLSIGSCLSTRLVLVLLLNGLHWLSELIPLYHILGSSPCAWRPSLASHPGSPRLSICPSPSSMPPIDKQISQEEVQVHVHL